MTAYAPGYDPNTPPTFPDTPKTSAAQAASDTRLSREIDATNRAIGAARTAIGADAVRLASIKTVLSGRARALWEPVHKRTLRGDQRARGALTVPEAADPTSRIVAAMRAAGEAGEPVDPDGANVGVLVEFHRNRTDADALAAARNEVGRQTITALTDAVKDMRRDLFNAIAADLRDLAREAQSIADDLDGVETAEDAISHDAVSAWQARSAIRKQVVEVACALHWVRRRTDRGFVGDATGRVDAWPLGNDDRHTSAKTWEALDRILDQLKVSDAARAILTGQEA